MQCLKFKNILKSCEFRESKSKNVILFYQVEMRFNKLSEISEENTTNLFVFNFSFQMSSVFRSIHIFVKFFFYMFDRD